MRTTTLITGAALAATAFAGPIFKRDLEIDTVYDVAYETVYVTETEGVTIPVTVSAEQPAPAATTQAAVTSQYYGHRHSWSAPAAESSAASVTVVTSEAAAVSVVSSATSAPAAASSSADPKAAIPAQGYTSAWTSSWASTWVVTPSAESTTAVATSAAPAATTEVSLLKSFNYLLSRDSLHPRVNFESLMAQMFHPASSSSSQVKRATSTVKTTSTVKASSSTKKTTVSSKATSTSKKSSSSSQKTSSTSKKSSSTSKVSTTLKGTPVSTKASTTSQKTSSTKKASSTVAAPSGKATTYQEIVLAHHNVHRANHSACNLEWDSQLAATAQQIAATCVYAHSMDVNGGGYGQNIAAGVEANNVSAVITELFYNGEVGYYNNLYGQANPDMTNFEKWGHFSQLVWKGTTKVGCATQYCSGGLANVGQYVAPYFTVCNYGAPGNYAGEYADNVGASLNQPTQNWSYDL